METAPHMPHMVVTGSQGFVAQGLLSRHLQPLAEQGRIRLSTTDLQGEDTCTDTVRHVRGDIGDAATWDRLLDRPADIVFHLAAVVSGQAERDPALGRRVNLLACLEGLERCRLQQALGGPKVRWIYASSIAVWGTGLPSCVDDRHPVRPELSYGAHKRMMELMIHDLSRRGELDGRSLRLSGVVVRPRVHGAALSAFNSDVIREPLQGRTVTCPVRPDGCVWLCSRDATVDQLWALATVDAAQWHQACLTHGMDSVVNAPTWPVPLAALVDALGRIEAAAPSRMRFDPAAPLHAAFGNWPLKADFALARALGLPEDTTFHGHDIERFVRACMRTA